MKTTLLAFANCTRSAARPFLLQISRSLLASGLCGLATLAHAADETVAGNLTVTGTAAINATTASTSKDTGALVVEGGVGVEGNVTVGGTVSATLLIASGGAINGGSSGLTLNAGGADQNITLVTTGAGQVNTFKSQGYNNAFSLTANSIQIAMGQNGSNGLYFFRDGSASPSGATAYGIRFTDGLASGNNGYFDWVMGGNSALRIFNGGTFGFGTSTDSGNGRLQLANHTDSTGGIGFGSDTSFYRTDAGQLMLRSSATQPGFFIRSTAFTTAGGMRIAGGGGELLQIGSGYAGSSNFAEVQIGPSSTVAPELTISTTKVKVVPATASTSSSTGALVVNGGVGIGGNLNVGGGGLFTGQVITTQGSNQSIRMDGTGEFGLEWRDTASGVRWDIWNGVNGSYGENWDNHLIFHQRDNGSGQAGIVATLTPSRNLFIKNSLGIGTPTPTEKLDVAGSAKISGNLSTGSLTIGGQGFDPLYYLRSTSNTAAVLSPGSTTNYTEGLRVNDAANGNALLHLGGSATSGTGTGQWAVLKDPSGKFGLRENNVDRLSILPGSGNVGIGTTTPSATLDVENNLTNGGQLLLASNAGATASAGLTFRTPFGGVPYNGGIYSSYYGSNVVADSGTQAVQGLTFISPRDLTGWGYRFNSNGGATRVFIDTASGNVGIGTTTPLSKLHIEGGGITWSEPTYGMNLNFVRGNGANAGIGFAGSVIGANISTTLTSNSPTIGANVGGLTTAAAVHMNGDSNATGAPFGVWTGYGPAGTALTQRLAIAAGGNVGIGTTSPQSKVHISVAANTNLHFTGSSTIAQIASLNDAGNTYQPLFLNSNTTTFNINGSEAMRVASNGNVGLGTMTPATSLTVASDNVVSGGVTIGSGTAADGGNLRLLSSTNHWNLDNYVGDLRFFTETGYGTGGATRMTLTKEGNLTVGGNVTVAGTLTPAAVSSAGQISGQSFGSDNGNFTLAGGPGTHALSLNSGSSTVATFNAAGTGYASGNLLTLSSDTGNGSNNFIRFRAGMAATPIDFGNLKFDGTAGLMVNSGGDLSLSAGGTSGSVKLSPTATGSVAMRVAAPSAKFHYNSTVAAPFATDVNAGSPDVLFTAGDQQQSTFIARFAAGVANTVSTTSLDLATLSKNVEFDSGFRLTAGTGTGSTTNNGYFAISGLRNRAATVSELLRLTSSGNVGIGTTTPNSKLEIAGGSGTAATVRTTTDAIGDTTQLNLGANPSIPQGGAILKSVRTSASGANTDLAVLTTLSGEQGEVMRVTSGGNVGVGTTSPETKLDVNGTMRVQSELRFGSVNDTWLSRSAMGNLSLSHTGSVIPKFTVAANGMYGALSAALTLSPQGATDGDFTVQSEPNEGPSLARGTYFYQNGVRALKVNSWMVSVPVVTNSVSPTTGSLVVAGGTGIGGNLNVGGTLKTASLTVGDVAFGSPNDYVKTTGGGNLSVTSLTASGGAITGNGTNGFTISSSGSGDTNIYLDPSGTGDVVIPVGNTLKMNGATQRLGQINIGTNTGTTPTEVALLDFGDVNDSGSLRGVVNGGNNVATWKFGYRMADGSNPDSFKDGLTLVTTASGATSLTGGAAGLTLYAGGDNQNIALIPSGTGSTILNGNVGIGTTAPTHKLHIDGGVAAGNNSQLKLSANGQGTISALAYAPDNGFVGFDVDYEGAHIARSTSAAEIQKGAGFLYVMGNTGLTSGSSFAPTTRVALDLSNGNFGIGTTAPNAKLDVVGVGSFRSSTNGGGTLAGPLNGSSNLGMHIGYDSGTDKAFLRAEFPNNSWRDMVIGMNSLEIGNNTGTRLYINSGGNVGIGTTSPTQKLHVAGNATIGGNATITGNTTLGTSGGNNTVVVNGAVGIGGTPGNGQALTVAGNVGITNSGTLGVAGAISGGSLNSGVVNGAGSDLAINAATIGKDVVITTTGAGATKVIGVFQLDKDTPAPGATNYDRLQLSEGATAFDLATTNGSTGTPKDLTFSPGGTVKGTWRTSGSLLLGTTSETLNGGRLQLGTNADSTAAAGIGFGSDTTLYRSADNTLKTGGKFVTVANVGIGSPAGTEMLTVGGSGKFTTTLSVGGVVSVADTTSATTAGTGSGSLITAGGIYAAKNVVAAQGGFTGQSLTANGTDLTLTAGTATTNKVVVTNTTPSTTSATGALVVNGGAGIAQNLHVGGSASVATTFQVGNPAGGTGTTISGGAVTASGLVTALSVTATAGIKAENFAFQNGEGSVTSNSTGLSLNAGTGRSVVVQSGLVANTTLSALGRVTAGTDLVVAGKVGIGLATSANPEAPLQVAGHTSTTDGEIARFGQGSTSPQARSYLRLLNQDPTLSWEMSVQNDSGTGNQNGFGLWAKDNASGATAKPRFYVSSPTGPSADRSFARIYAQDPDSAWELSVEDSSGGGGPSPGFALRSRAGTTVSAPHVFVTPAGDVGLGTSNPAGNKLAVNGTIRATEVVVEEANLPDFVFKGDYRNAPLSEVEQHIKEHKHLPGVPSASDVAEKGLSVGKMQSVLLQKVEELTLHLIAQDKRIQKLEAENAVLRGTP